MGRLGGDEFAVYKEFFPSEGADIKAQIEKDMDILFKNFDKEFTEEKKQCDISLSVGIYICENADVSFQDMYTRGDAALYHSKRNGKNQYTIYSEGLLKEQKEMEADEEK